MTTQDVPLKGPNGDIGGAARLVLLRSLPARFTGRGLALLGSVNLMPVLAIVLLFSLLAALLWIIHKNEQEQSRLDLVRDTLWVERALQFQIASDDETLQHIADDLHKDKSDMQKFLAPAHQLLASDPAIVALEWIDAKGAIITREAQRPLIAREPSGDEKQALDEAIYNARRTGGPVATRPFAWGSGTAISYIAQIDATATGSESLVAILSLDKMLDENIPWWIAGKRAVEIRDHEGHLLAARSTAMADKLALGQTIAFGTQPAGLFITLYAGQAPTNFTRDGLVGAIAVLGVLAVGGLLARESHLRKRRLAESALQNEHAFRKAMEDSLTVGMRARDLKGRIIYVNQSFCRMVGWPSEDLVGRDPPMPYWAPEEMEKTTAFHNRVLSGSPPADGAELRFRRQNGSPLVALVQEAPLIGADGQQTGWMGSFIDITERKAADELARRQTDQIETTSRLVLIGEMASILAHDLNQPLATISGYQAGLINRLSSGSIAHDEVVATLVKVGEAAQRAGQIIHRVQDVVRRNEPRFEPVDVAELVQRTVTIFQNEPRPMPSRIALSAGRPARVARCDDILIEQVLINLLRNAEEAMHGLPGQLRCIDVSVSTGASAVKVEIADRGPGVPDHLLGDIFGPFVSTKAGGLGLGLTICRSVLEAHRSQLICTPRADGGSIFKFSLAPLAT